ncbi:hypothetical protein A2X44_00450 [candidate division CPR3 bacterium GWF2_35_18]|uniref:Uncharacterized protein n=1 Tax=candidate division CPR3 bacterium GW2011_GWF2_35_18 TaxID=1618350 RepID=A0A0G0BL05_UNCC3|nr:MAG: hypothetical protein UR67_C0001G0073 [candidate division CPR3 bacterium GW2011_GWF2_35_18]KKP86732.1 MAG: hypothetical protein UR87_C0012G0024 [candidate division CPR3 bacterium GW2011_GWE2_35_7]OGB63384.1 MAG: hypothetical protein A2X44_00450 [candidate division CPR3 bacterium GWF2_35_18]OGB64871.1 MAG: hypothetical protein A2250_05580 [candidate division CPR3 bacterium RIFOXYA2_FULL_35_13]OGB76832.1 MAG: hypothetical protein A2476_05290 [candidate division CPR3 bacterium RIFOXYC2_FULL
MAGLKLGEAPTKTIADAFWNTETTEEKFDPEKKAAQGLLGLRTINCKGNPEKLAEFDEMVNQQRSQGKSFTEIYEEVEAATFSELV